MNHQHKTHKTEDRWTHRVETCRCGAWRTVAAAETSPWMNWRAVLADCEEQDRREVAR